MKIIVFGLSVTSTWGNGHGTTYRALLRALRDRGHEITFVEKDVEWYASNRDLPNPEFCTVWLYECWDGVLPRVRQELKSTDVAMVGSYFPDGVAALDEVFEADVPVKAFYDIDTPITVKALRETGKIHYLEARQIPHIDVYFSFTGGPMLREIEDRLGAPRATPLYCSFDPDKYCRRSANETFACDLSYMGTYAPDRQPKLEEFLCNPAQRLTDRKFMVAGPQYPSSISWPGNITRIPHLSPVWHPEFYSSSRLTLNITRRDMSIAGYSPSVRLFEAAACGTAVISDNWPGLDGFFVPGEEILLPIGADEVIRYLTELSEGELGRIGESAQTRVLAEHTSAHRALEFEREIEKAAAFPQMTSSVPPGIGDAQNDAAER